MSQDASSDCTMVSAEGQRGSAPSMVPPMTLATAVPPVAATTEVRRSSATVTRFPASDSR